MTKLSKKSPKPYFGDILGPFCPNLSRNKFSWKNGFCQFLNIPSIYHLAKNNKKLMTKQPIPEKNVELMEGQTDRQTDSDFIGPSVIWGANILVLVMTKDNGNHDIQSKETLP